MSDWDSWTVPAGHQSSAGTGEPSPPRTAPPTASWKKHTNQIDLLTNAACMTPIRYNLS